MPVNNTLSNITARDHNCMRACATLAITNIQFGQMRLFHQNLSRYHAIVAMDGLHNEANWPKDIGIVEVEERRRLVSWYALDHITMMLEASNCPNCARICATIFPAHYVLPRAGRYATSLRHVYLSANETTSSGQYTR